VGYDTGKSSDRGKFNRENWEFYVQRMAWKWFCLILQIKGEPYSRHWPVPLPCSFSPAKLKNQCSLLNSV
jgi:hypothetical protein